MVLQSQMLAQVAVRLPLSAAFLTEICLVMPALLRFFNTRAKQKNGCKVCIPADPWSCGEIGSGVKPTMANRIFSFPS
jgi:hypothetical protein